MSDIRNWKKYRDVVIVWGAVSTGLAYAFVLDLLVALVYIGIRIKEFVRFSAAYHHYKKCC